MTDDIGPRWHGWLTHENVDAVAARIKSLLEGKRFTFVALNAGDMRHGDLRAAVETGCRLAPGDYRDKAAIRPYHKGDLIDFIPGSTDRHSRSGMTIAITRSVLPISTTLSDETRAVDLRIEGPHIGFGHGKVSIEHKAGAGHKILWIMALEQQEQ